MPESDDPGDYWIHLTRPDGAGREVSADLYVSFSQTANSVLPCLPK